MKIADIRQEYDKFSLADDLVPNSPFDLFDQWMKEAIKIIPEPTALTLGTASKEGKPSTRVVLLKDYSDNGFTFFSNYKSRKGIQLEENPFASLTFFWGELQRQVQIEGVVEKVSQQESVDYFNSRPKESQIGAIVSQQSSVINSKKELLDRFEDIKSKNPTIEKPEHWGGYKVIPTRIEFWQGGKHRLHDRFVFELIDNNWTKNRVAP